MPINHTNLLSGRAVVVDYGNLSTDRNQFLSLGEAEPNLGPGAANAVLTLGPSNTRVFSNALSLNSVSASGNIYAAYLHGDGSNITGIATAQANALIGNTLSSNVIYSSLTTVGILNNVYTTGVVSAVGNIYGNNASLVGNLTVREITASDLAASGNLVSANLSTGTITSTNISSSGNIISLTLTTGNVNSASISSSGNIITLGLSASGNVQSNNVTILNRANLNNVTATTISVSGTTTAANATFSENLLANSITSNTTLSSANLSVSGTAVLPTITSVTNSNVTITASGNGVINLDNLAISDTTFSATGNLFTIAGNSGFILPVGNTPQRPSSPLIGTTRFNTTINNVETFDGVEWVSGNSALGSIADQQITPSGSTASYTLIQPATTTSVIVSINGVTQLPNVAYTVSGTTITFATAPLSSDIIDIRFISYLTTIDALSNDSGNSYVSVSNTPTIDFGVAGNAAASFNASGNLDVYGNIVSGNIYTNNYLWANGQPFVTPTSYGNANVATYLSVGTSSNIVVNTGNYFIGDGSKLTNLPASSSYSNANVVAYAQSGFGGNIIPASNVTYSLGNVTNQWSELYVSGNTIYVGGVSIATTGNTLTIAGNSVVTANPTGNSTTTGNMQIVGNITASNFNSSGNVTAGYIIGDGSQLQNITAANVNGIVGNAAAIVTANFSVRQVANKLMFYYGNVAIASMDSTGIITGAGNIVGGGTP